MAALDSEIRPTRTQTSLLDDHSELEPPDPIPNSEVKRLSADGSVGFPHVRVGHRQALKLKRPVGSPAGRFFYVPENLPVGLADALRSR